MKEPERAAQAPRRSFRLWIVATSTLGFGVWWIASILLHGALFGVLTMVAPERPVQVASPEEFTMTISPDRVEEVVEEIRSRKSEEFEQQVQELMEIQHELEAANLAKVEQYNALMKSEAALAPENIKKATQEALAAQSEAMAAQDQAKAALAKQDEASAAAAPTPLEAQPPTKPDREAAKAELEKAQADTAAAQNKVMVAQVQIEQQLDVLGDAAGEIRRTNQANAALQNQAAKLQMDAKNAAQALDRVRTREDALRAKEPVDKARADAELQRQAEVDAKIAALQAAGKPPSRELTQLLDKQQKNKQTVQRAVQIASEDASKLAELGPALNTALQQAQQAEERAQQAQAQAKEALARAAEPMAAVAAKASETVPAPLPKQQEPTPVKTQNLAELYQQALETENALTGTFKQVRAAELATIRKLPMAQALALTEVAKPVRNSVNTKILSEEIRDVQGVQTQEKAINAAAAELDSMVSLARRMKELALPEGGATVTVGELKTQASHNDKMEQLALQSEGARAKDLAGEMGSADATGREAAGAGNGEEDLRFANENEPPSYLFAAPKDMKPIPGRTIGSAMQATPAGRDGVWMFVDSWYLIGPWPNPGRKNLNTKFPPETVVDLNATYTGGRRDEKPIPVRWRFFQAPAYAPSGPRQAEQTGQVIPPGLGEYEIYYAYTELWFDDARDLWVAIGSDDQSKIWVNDDMIWKSSDDMKAWVPNEGLRKVHFRKGINRILYRYENGHMSGCFSLWISLKSTANAPMQTNVLRGK